MPTQYSQQKTKSRHKSERINIWLGIGMSLVWFVAGIVIVMKSRIPAGYIQADGVVVDSILRGNRRAPYHWVIKFTAKDGKTYQFEDLEYRDGNEVATKGMEVRVAYNPARPDLAAKNIYNRKSSIFFGYALIFFVTPFTFVFLTIVSRAGNSK